MNQLNQIILEGNIVNDIDDVYESKVFAFPQLATYYDLGYWANSDAKSYIVQIKAVEESVK